VLFVIILTGLGLVILGGVHLVTSRPVVLVIEGVRREVRTHQPTVERMLTELALLIEPQDIVSPSGETPITNGLTVTINKAHPVVVEADDQRWRVLTHAVQPSDVLAEIDVTLGPRDVLYVDGAPLQAGIYTRPPASLRVERAITVFVEDNGEVSTVETVSHTVGEALYAASISLYLADEVVPPLDSPISDGMTIRIQRSFVINIQVDGHLLPTRTRGETVGAALAEAGIALIGLDYAVPDEQTPATPGMTIRVVRVTETDEVERTEIAYQRVTQTDVTIPPDAQKVIQQGMNGLLERRIRIRLEDGIEVSRSAPQDVIVRDPRDEIIGIGALPSLIDPSGTAEPAEPAPGS
jgi:uncharacterized protein YabE (DUF348 family)